MLYHFNMIASNNNCAIINIQSTITSEGLVKKRITTKLYDLSGAHINRFIHTFESSGERVFIFICA